MTLLQGEIIIFGRGRYFLAVLEKWNRQIAPHHNEDRERSRPGAQFATPRPLAVRLRGYARSGGAGLKMAFAVGSFGGGWLAMPERHGPERSEPNGANVRSSDTATRSDASRMGGAGGNHHASIDTVESTEPTRTRSGAGSAGWRGNRGYQRRATRLR